MPVTIRRRWWLLRALGRNRMPRAVDRVEAWAAIACMALLAVSVLLAAHVAQSVSSSQSATFAHEGATRHPIEAVAVGASQSAAQGPVTAYSAHVRWFAHNETHDKLVRTDHAVESGAHIPIWVDDEGNATPPPRTVGDARADGAAAAALTWLAVLVASLTAMAVLRRGLNRLRYRAWDRDIRTLVDNDGGWATRNS